MPNRVIINEHQKVKLTFKKTVMDENGEPKRLPNGLLIITEEVLEGYVSGTICNNFCAIYDQSPEGFNHCTIEITL